VLERGRVSDRQTFTQTQSHNHSHTHNHTRARAHTHTHAHTQPPFLSLSPLPSLFPPPPFPAPSTPSSLPPTHLACYRLSLPKFDLKSNKKTSVTPLRPRPVCILPSPPPLSCVPRHSQTA